MIHSLIKFGDLSSEPVAMFSLHRKFIGSLQIRSVIDFLISQECIYLIRRVQTGSEVYPASYPIGTESRAAGA
jgi:hypothetical protein